MAETHWRVCMDEGTATDWVGGDCHINSGRSPIDAQGSISNL